MGILCNDKVSSSANWTATKLHKFQSSLAELFAFLNHCQILTFEILNSSFLRHFRNVVVSSDVFWTHWTSPTRWGVSSLDSIFHFSSFLRRRDWVGKCENVDFCSHRNEEIRRWNHSKKPIKSWSLVCESKANNCFTNKFSIVVSVICYRLLAAFVADADISITKATSRQRRRQGKIFLWNDDDDVMRYLRYLVNVNWIGRMKMIWNISIKMIKITFQMIERKKWSIPSELNVFIEFYWR